MIANIPRQDKRRRKRGVYSKSGLRMRRMRRTRRRKYMHSVKKEEAERASEKLEEVVAWAPS